MWCINTFKFLQTFTLNIFQLDSARLFLKPEDLIYLSLSHFMDIIKNLTPEHITLCKEIRRKGRNKIHALKCRKKGRDEVSRLKVIHELIKILSELKLILCYRNKLKGQRSDRGNSWMTTEDFRKNETLCTSS